MFCSTIIPTIGRSTLSRAVHSILKQTFTADKFEIIVVNDSGQPLSEADWQESEKVQVINTNRRERSFARNTGAAIARGRYLHFLDDDDWLLPDALENFWEPAQTNNAAWLYGGSQLVDRHETPLVRLHLGMGGNCFTQAMAGEWIPIQASLINAEAFFTVGGFNPFLTVGEDKDLCRRIALRDDLIGTPAVVVCIERDTKNSTTDYARSSEHEHRLREKILSEPGVFGRMRASANSSYWYGRIVRVYLVSTIRNLQDKRIFTVASRAIFGLLSLILVGHYLLVPDFWRAVTRRHMSRITEGQ